MSDNEAEIRRELESVEAYHARIRDHLRRIEAERDRLLAKLKDGDGQGEGRVKVSALVLGHRSEPLTVECAVKHFCNVPP